MIPKKVPREGPYDSKVQDFAKALEDPCPNCQRMLRVILGEQTGQKAPPAVKKPKQPVDSDTEELYHDEFSDEYYEELGKQTDILKMQAALDASTSQNVLKYFGIAQLKKDVGLKK